MAHDFSNPPPIGSDFHDHLSTPFPNFLAIDPNMDHFQFTDQPNPTSKAADLDTSPVILLSASNFQNLPMSFPEFPGGSADAFPRTMFHPGEHVSGLVPRTVPAMGNGLCDSRKRKAPDVFGTNFGKSVSPPFWFREILFFILIFSSLISSVPILQDEGGAKRLKNAGKVEGEEQDEEEEQEEEEQEKPKKGAHARARRGQATDSHSLAERVPKRTAEDHHLTFRKKKSDLIPFSWIILIFSFSFFLGEFETGEKRENQREAEMLTGHCSRMLQG